MSCDPCPAPVSVVQRSSPSFGPVTLVRVANSINSISRLILKSDGFSRVPKAANPRAENVFSRIGSGVEGVEGGGIRRDDEVAVTGEDGPGRKGKCNSLAEGPAGELDLGWRLVVKLDPFRHWILGLCSAILMIKDFVYHRVCRALRSEGKKGNQEQVCSAVE